MRSNAENVQAAVKRNLNSLSVGKSRPKAAPGRPKVRANVNAIIGSDIKGVGRGAAVDLDRPDRQVWKIAADAGPTCSAIKCEKNLTVSAEFVDYSVGFQRTGRWIHLNVIDPAAAGREIVLRPSRAMVSSDEDLAAARSDIECVGGI